ncbi:hypothetical protein P7C70_g291, partial [Phenoliferia sp. Uapishka_3]
MQYHKIQPPNSSLTLSFITTSTLTFLMPGDSSQPTVIGFTAWLNIGGVPMEYIPAKNGEPLYPPIIGTTPASGSVNAALVNVQAGGQKNIQGEIVASRKRTRGHSASETCSSPSSDCDEELSSNFAEECFDEECWDDGSSVDEESASEDYHIAQIALHTQKLAEKRRSVVHDVSAPAKKRKTSAAPEQDEDEKMETVLGENEVGTVEMQVDGAEEDIST